MGICYRSQFPCCPHYSLKQGAFKFVPVAVAARDDTTPRFNKRRESTTLDPLDPQSLEALPLDSQDNEGAPPLLTSHHSESDLHKVIDSKINRWLEKTYAGIFAASYVNPYLLLKSLLVSIIIYALLWTFPYPMATFYFPFAAIYFTLVLDKKAVEKFRSWKKKDPSNLKIKDKIHFYESFGELDLPVKRSKASEVRKRHAGAMLHSEDYLKFRSVDNLLKNNMMHRRTGSHPDFLREDSPPSRRHYQREFSPPPKSNSSLSLVVVTTASNTGGGSSGGSGDESKDTTLVADSVVGEQLAERMNSKDEARNELSELQKERKVKSTLVLLKKQHPSYVEERLDWNVSTATLPTPRTSHTCTLYGSSIVLLGGDNAAADVHFLDVDKLAWGTPRVTGARAAPTSMHGHDCCRIGNRFYIFGGYVNNQLSNKLHILSLIDDATVHWSQPRVSGNSPSPRMGHTLTRYANKFILFGGFDGRSWLNDVHFLDTDTMTWSQPIVHGKPPIERCGHTATIVGDRLIVLGGNNSTGEFNDINILMLETMTWVQGNPIGEQPPERTYHATARVGRNLIMIGGKREGVILKDVWLLQANVTEKICWWKVTGTQPTPRAHHSLVRTDTRLFLLGGKGSANSILDDIWSTNTAVMAPMTLSDLPVVEYPEIKLEKEIGMGNFSKVIRGSWKQKEVAVKKITIKKEKSKNDVLMEFKSEVALLSNLRHPNLVTCFGYCLSPMCIVMEYLPGNLYDFIHTQKAEFGKVVDSTLLLQFAFDIARGMQYLHSQNIIHRDLKSSNLLLDKHLNVKIADLGIARETTHTQTMTTIGTVAWTAPEILRHDSYNQLADVYSYAIVLWELITGKIPFSGIPPMNAGILVASNQLRPELPADCDPDWRHLVTWCWSEDPNKRPTFDATIAYLTANC